MIQGFFYRMIRPKAEGFSDSQFRLGIQAFNAATRQLAFGAKPVQQKLPMAPQHAGDFFHGLNLRLHCPPTPLVQKLPRPIWRGICPEKLEVFLQQIAPHRAKIVPHQLGQTDFLLGTQVLWAFQEQPPRLRQEGLIALRFKRPRFLRELYLKVVLGVS